MSIDVRGIVNNLNLQYTEGVPNLAVLDVLMNQYNCTYPQATELLSRAVANQSIRLMYGRYYTTLS